LRRRLRRRLRTGCSGLLFLAGKTGEEPFRDFWIDERTGRPAPMVIPPAGLEGAFDRKVKRLEKSDACECVRVTPVQGLPAGTLTMAERAKACLPASTWVLTPMAAAEPGLEAQRYVNAAQKREIVVLTVNAPIANMPTLRETVSVLALR
jgi:hypothetical protein